MRKLCERMLCFSFCFLGSLALGATRLLPLAPELAANPPGLGQAYHSANAKFLDRCWSGEVQYAGQSVSTLKFEHSLSREELERDIQASFEGGIQLFIVGGSVSSTVASQLKEARFRETLIYKAEVQGRTALVSGARLLPAYAAERERDPELFKAHCGDAFVSQIHLGASLYILVHFDFVDQSQLDQFRTQIKISVLGFSRTKTIAKDIAWNDDTAQISIETLQLGGRPELLAARLGPAPPRCKLSQMEACAARIETLMDYAIGQGPEDFPAQAAQLDLAGPRPSVRSLRLTDADAARSREARSDAPKLAREIFETLDADGKVLRELLAIYPSGSARHRSFRALLEDSLSPLRDRIYRYLHACQAEPSACEGIKNFVSPASWSSYQEKRKILAERSSFVDFCLLPTEDPGLGSLVTSVLSELGYSREERARSPFVCEAAEARLTRLKSLNLSGRGLARLEALGAARALETLDLSRNALRDLGLLRSLKQLRVLDLSHNQLDSLFALRGLPLEKLNASYNRLVDLEALRALPLDTLILHGTRLAHAELPLRAAQDIRSEGELCRWQRQRLLELGAIGRSTFLAYESADFLPWLSSEGRVEARPCLLTAPDYDASAYGLFPIILTETEENS